MEFYKGHIVDVNNLKEYSYILDLFLLKGEENITDLYCLLVKMSDGVMCAQKDKIDSLMVNMFRPQSSMEAGEQIIYLKETDENGNSYGKEVITGLVFPISNKYSSFDITYKKIEPRRVYLDREHSKVYSFGEQSLFNVYSLINGNFGRENYIPHELQHGLSNMNFGETKEIIIRGDKTNLECTTTVSFEINIKPKMIFPNDKEVNYAVTRESIANELEVSRYFEKIEYGFGKRKRRKEYYKLLQTLYLKNKLGNFVFDKKIEEPVKIKRLK